MLSAILNSAAAGEENLIAAPSVGAIVVSGILSCSGSQAAASGIVFRDGASGTILWAEEHSTTPSSTSAPDGKTLFSCSPETALVIDTGSATHSKYITIFYNLMGGGED